MDARHAAAPRQMRPRHRPAPPIASAWLPLKGRAPSSIRFCMVRMAPGDRPSCACTCARVRSTFGLCTEVSASVHRVPRWPPSNMRRRRRISEAICFAWAFPALFDERRTSLGKLWRRCNDSQERLSTKTSKREERQLDTAPRQALGICRTVGMVEAKRSSNVAIKGGHGAELSLIHI